MDADALVASLQTAHPDAQIERVPSVDLQTTCYVSRDALPALARALRDQPEFAFTFLAELTAVDFWPKEPRYEVVYLLVSMAHRMRLRLKGRMSGDDPHITTVSDVWPAANWLEREVWDLFGIAFEGHPDPRRLLMPEDWVGYPLRKDYPVQINTPVRTTEPLQMSEDEFRANLEKDRLARR